MIGFVLQSRSNGDTEAGALMFGSLYFILIKCQLLCQVSNAGTDVFCVCVSVCVCVCVRARSGAITSTVSLYQQNHLYKGQLLFVYTHNEIKTDFIYNM